MCTPIAAIERRWLWRTAADWLMQFGWVHPAPLDRLVEVGAAAADKAAAADEADAADVEDDAESVEGFRLGVSGGSAAGRPCPRAAFKNGM
jgi:hypothetical protein